MPLNISDLQIRFSGGASNSNPALSLGGVISSAIVPSQSVAAPVTVTGVTIIDAANNAVGLGSLWWDMGTSSLKWRPYGSTVYSGVKFSVN